MSMLNTPMVLFTAATICAVVFPVPAHKPFAAAAVQTVEPFA